ncbi:MAG: hypothetical protein ACREFS_11905 [Acetobacteraceae bacterium]
MHDHALGSGATLERLERIKAAQLVRPVAQTAKHGVVFCTLHADRLSGREMNQSVAGCQRFVCDDEPAEVRRLRHHTAPPPVRDSAPISNVAHALAQSVRDLYRRFGGRRPGDVSEGVVGIGVHVA